MLKGRNGRHSSTPITDLACSHGSSGVNQISEISGQVRCFHRVGLDETELAGDRNELKPHPIV